MNYGSRFSNFALFTSLTESQLMSINEAGPRIDPPPSSFVTEAIELDEEEAVPEVEMITTEPKVSET